MSPTTVGSIDHAIIVGASMAGMLTAAAVARHARKVTILERDPLPDEISNRKGVPQDYQAHLLLDRGREAIARLLPDLFDALDEGGAQRVDFGREFWWFHGDHWKVRCDTPYTLSFQTRPFLEHYTRACLLRRPNVELRSRVEVRAPIIEEGRVTGVSVHDRQQDTTQTLPCDLFIDASGRGSRSPRWLSEAGYGEPPEISTRIDLAYASRLYRRPADAPREWKCRVVYGLRPTHRRHGLVMTVERDKWLFSFVGYEGDHPPGDPEGLESFARGLARPDLFELMRRAEPVSEVRRCKFPSQRWLRYDKLDQLPAGYAVMGDAVCSLDPVFGQGITVAAIEAELLGAQLEQRGSLDPRAFARACAQVIANPWMMTSAEAFRYPSAQGDRPPGLGLLHRLVDRVYHCSATDPVVYRAFLRVLQLHAGPSALVHPGVLLRLLRGGAVPEGDEPVSV